MTSSFGFLLWGQIAGLTLGFAITHEWWYIQFLIWFIMVIRGTSDMLAPYSYTYWSCIFCGKSFSGTAWQAFTTICNHDPYE